MFEDILPGGLQLGVKNLGGNIMQGLQWGVLLGLLVAGVLYLLFVMSFKHKFRIYEVVNDRKIVFDDKAREYRDTKGVLWWQLLKKKEKIQTPPPEAIEINNKGKKCVIAYKTETGEYVFSKDTWNIKRVPQEIRDISDKGLREVKVKAWHEENKIIEAHEPYTTQQRLILINQHEKALIEKSKKWTEHIPMIVGIGAAVILIVSLFVFWGDLAQPLLEMKDKQNDEAKIRQDTLEIIARIDANIQKMEAQTTPNPQPPS